MFAITSIKQGLLLPAEPAVNCALLPHTSALALFRDFRDIAPLRFRLSTPATEAAQALAGSPYDFGLVMSATGELVGYLPESALTLEYRLVLKGDGYDLPLLDAGQLMVPLVSMMALEMESLASLSVRKLAAMMDDKDLQELVVMDSARGEIRAIITTDHMRRLMPLPPVRPKGLSKVVANFHHQ